MATLQRGAIEYNTARTTVRVGDSAVLSPGALDDLTTTEIHNGVPLSSSEECLNAVLMGYWVAADARCTPTKGQHVDGCNHRHPIPATQAAVADLIYSGHRGYQLRKVRELLARRAARGLDSSWNEPACLRAPRSPSSTRT